LLAAEALVVVFTAINKIRLWEMFRIKSPLAVVVLQRMKTVTPIAMVRTVERLLFSLARHWLHLQVAVVAVVETAPLQSVKHVVKLHVAVVAAVQLVSAAAEPGPEALAVHGVTVGECHIPCKEDGVESVSKVMVRNTVAVVVAVAIQPPQTPLPTRRLVVPVGTHC
jgi:hypothetical protein